jgi:hypothetical protein
MSPIAILKLLKTAKDIHDYVKKPNNLDAQNEMILHRLKKLEDVAHPIRDFVTCECCKNKLKKKEKKK